MIELLQVHFFFADKTIDTCTRLEHQGYCNENYLVVAEGVKYIARKLLRDDIDRVFEWKIQNLAFEQGIVAEPFIFDKKNGFMVFEFLEGEHKSALSKDNLKYLAHTLQKLHNIKLDSKRIAIRIENKTDDIVKAFETIEKYKKENVLCHNDLNPQNILWSKDVKFIDLEYAGVNDRYFDLACVCVEFRLSDEVQDLFLNVYFGDDDFVLEKLKAYKVIYKTLCEEWFNSSI